MRRSYKNPPIEEAVVEIQFRSGNGEGWDLTFPGRFHALVKDEYPGKPRQQKIVQHNLVLVGAHTIQGTQSIGKVQFPSTDGKKLISVGPDLLSIHTLRPYSGWEDFFPRIQRAFQVYCDVAKPVGIVRIGLRYVNMIPYPDAGKPLNAYFTRAVPECPGLPGILRQFVHVDHFHFDDGALWQLTFALQPPSSLILDIDLIDQQERVCKGVIERIDELRERERKIFEALITDEMRAVFDNASSD